MTTRRDLCLCGVKMRPDKARLTVCVFSNCGRKSCFIPNFQWELEDSFSLTRDWPSLSVSGWDNMHHPWNCKWKKCHQNPMDGDRKGLVVQRQKGGLSQPESVLSEPDSFSSLHACCVCYYYGDSLYSPIVASCDFARVRCLAHITVCLRTHIPKDPSWIGSWKVGSGTTFYPWGNSHMHLFADEINSLCSIERA